MIRIAVCDDEKYFREMIKNYVETYLAKKEIAYEIDTFRSGKAFLERETEILDYSIVFLDINMNEIDGITIAQKIREYSSDTYIVFVTAYIDYSLEGYKVDAVRYLLKNNSNLEEAVKECMNTILQKMNYIISKKRFKFHEGEKELPLERILYIESNLHKLEFHVMEKGMVIYTMYGTLNDLEKEIQGSGFVRIHQSFLVNLKHIKKVVGYRLLLSNHQELSIPKSRYKEVKRVFIEYRGEI